MDGHKNEKAIIMFLSYFIGFITAFIALYFVAPSSDVKVVNVPMNQTEMVEVDATQATGPELLMEPIGLFVSVNGNKRILSANKASVIQANPDSLRENGFHFDIVGAQLSPNGNFVYYCEQLSEVPTECEPIVFSIEADMAYKIKINDSYSIPIESHQAVWSSDGLLSVNDFVSSSPEIPWK